MGSIRLKAKDQLGYRKARKKQAKCMECANLKFMRIFGIGGADLGMQYRCVLMGCGASIKYRVAIDHICNEFIQKKEATHER